MNSPSILGRTHLCDPFLSTPFQSQVDGFVSHFVEEAANPTTLAAMMAGGMAYRMGRIGVMAIGEGHVAAMPLRLLSMGVGLGSEVTAFEFTNRSLQTFRAHGRAPLQAMNENLWSWSGSGGWAEGLLTSTITFGMLKGAGFLGREQNIVFQHAFQSTAMVAGHQTAGLLGLGPRPEGTLAEQILHAEATNLQLGAGMGLVHFLAPRWSAWERSLDLSLTSEISRPSFLPGLFSEASLKASFSGGPSRELSQGRNPLDRFPHIFAMSQDKERGGSKSFEAEERDLERSGAQESLNRLLRTATSPTEEEKREWIVQIQEGVQAEIELTNSYLSILALRAQRYSPSTVDPLGLLQTEWRGLKRALSDYLARHHHPLSQPTPFSRDFEGRLESALKTSSSHDPQLTKKTTEIRDELLEIPATWQEVTRRIEKFPPLSPEREVDILQKISAGLEAETRLVKGHLRYLRKMAKGLGAYGDEVLDLMQEGWKGIRIASYRFDLTRRNEAKEPIKFLTYATWWIDHQMTRFLIDTGRNVRLPVHMSDRLRRLRKCVSELETQGLEPTPPRLAELMDMEVEKVRKLIELNHSIYEHSLDAPFGSEDEGGRRTTRLDLMPDPKAGPDQEVHERNFREKLYNVLSEFADSLQGLDRILLDERILEDQKTLKEIGQEHGLSAERIRQREERLRRRIRSFLDQKGFGIASSGPVLEGQKPISPSAPRRPVSKKKAVAPPEPAPPLPSSPPSLASPHLTPPSPQRSLELREVLRPRIAIVGFGAAGMGAAHHLRLPHLISDSSDHVRPTITVFEGLARPGGKIAPDNMGAQFLDADHFEPVTGMIQRLGLKTHPVADYDEADFLTRQGALLPGADFIRALQVLRDEVRQALRSRVWTDLDQRGAVDFIEGLFQSGRLSPLQRDAMLARLGFEEGTLNISALSFAINLAKSETPMPRLEMEGGLYRWAEAEMAALVAAGGEIRTHTRVDRIDLLNRGLKIYFEREGARSSEEFDFAVVALAPEHLPFVEINGSQIPFDRVGSLKPARINKTNLAIQGEPPGHEIATNAYAKWFSRFPQRAITFFSGWDGGEKTPTLDEMVEIAFRGKPPVQLIPGQIKLKTWNGYIPTGQTPIPHYYTTIPEPGRGMEIVRLAQEQFLMGRFDSEPIRLANHAMGLGVYVRDAALAGEWAAISILRSLGLSLKAQAQRNRDPRRDFFGVDPSPDLSKNR